jgi:hypothetical protein
MPVKTPQTSKDIDKKTDDNQPQERSSQDFGEYLRTNQMPEYTGVASSTWAKKRLTGVSPPYLKCGKIILYRRIDVDEWLVNQRRTSTSDTGGDHVK